SRELLERLVVNPNDAAGIVSAIGRALTMPVEEQAARIRAMQDRLRRYDARTWAMRFLERLDDVVRLSQDLAVKRLSAAHRDQIRQAYRGARSRLLLLDYDGPLVPFSIDRDAVPPDPQVPQILKDFPPASATH